MTKCLINDEPFNWEQSHYAHIINFSQKSVSEILTFYHVQILEATHVGKNNSLEQVWENVTV